MSFAGIHVKLFNDEQAAIVKKALEDAGHTVIATIESDAIKAWEQIKVKFPELAAGVVKGIHDVKDSTLSGGDKAVKVATDVLAVAPEALKDIPGIKDIIMVGVTTTFADVVSVFESSALALIAKL